MKLTNDELALVEEVQDLLDGMNVSDDDIQKAVGLMAEWPEKMRAVAGDIEEALHLLLPKNDG